MSSILDNLERVREQIAQAAAKAGRDVKDVELVAISKTHPAQKVREAVEAGQTLFGESRVQEARAKIPELSSNIRWHFVGHLQKNKVRQAGASSDLRPTTCASKWKRCSRCRACQSKG